MKLPKRIAVSVLVFGLVYTVLMIPWPVVRQAYGGFFRLMGNGLLGSVGGKGSVQFTSADEANWPNDTYIMIFNRQTRESLSGRRFSSRDIGWKPTAVLVAFVLATPIPWARRGKALLWGLLLVNGFVLIRLLLQLMFESIQYPSFDVFGLGEFGRRVFFPIYAALLGAPASAFIIPVFIWALVTFRRGDWASLFPDRTSPADSGKPVPPGA